VEEGADPVVVELEEPESDPLESVDQIVARFGGPVGDPCLVPGDDLVEPAFQGLAEGVDFAWAGVVLARNIPRVTYRS
jgi:hypothetical protein